MRRSWRDHNLTIVATTLFLVTFAAWAVVAWTDYASEASKHDKTADVGGYLSRFWAFTLENWQSEFLHIILLVVLTTFLVHRGSSESRDSDDRMEASLERIEKRLERLESQRTEPSR